MFEYLNCNCTATRSISRNANLITRNMNVCVIVRFDNKPLIDCKVDLNLNNKCKQPCLHTICLYNIHY